MTDAPIGPDSLTMAIALGGRPEDRAKIVWSRGCIAYFFPSQSAKAMPLSFRTQYYKMLQCNMIENRCSRRAAILLRLIRPTPEVYILNINNISSLYEYSAYRRSSIYAATWCSKSAA